MGKKGTAKPGDFVIVDDWYHLIPPIARDDEQTLMENIRRHGIISRIWVTPDMEIIDGYQRHRLVRQNKDLPQDMPYEVQDVRREDIPRLIFAINFQRRHLSRFNRAKIAVETAEKWGWFEKAAERQKTGANLGEISPQGDLADQAERTNKKIMEFFGVTEYYVRAVIRLRKASEWNLVSACQDGTMKVSKALEDLDKKEKRQAAALKEKTELDNLSFFIPFDTFKSFELHITRLAKSLWLPKNGIGINIKAKVQKPPKEKGPVEKPEKPWKPHPFQDWVCDHGIVGGCRKCYRDPESVEHGKKTAVRSQDKIDLPLDRQEIAGYRILPDRDAGPCKKCDYFDLVNEVCTLDISEDIVPAYCRKWRKDIL